MGFRKSRQNLKCRWSYSDRAGYVNTRSIQR